MICPKCKCEYREGFKVCIDCNIELVEKPKKPDKPELIALKPIKLISVANTIEAEMLMNLLRNNDIPCFMKDNFTGSYMNFYMGYTIFGEEIFVDERDYQKALDILNEIQYEVMDDALNDNEEEDYTSEDHIRFIKRPRKVACIILFAVFIIPCILVALLNILY